MSFVASAFAQSTVTLREGLNNYSGTRDNDGAVAYADSNRGTSKHYDLNWSTGAAFIKFAIFAAEGGPVPDGSTITSATLSVYQYQGAGSTWEARRLLKDWQEMQSTWNIAATGLPWQTAGALGAADIADTADGETTISSLGWLNIDVTLGVQAFASGASNYGWRLGWLSGTTGAKTFHSREADAVNAALRPTLTITYTAPPSGTCGSGSLRPYDSDPINNNPISINASGATTFEAEHYNCGGQGVAYNDTTPGSNAGQTFRANESVDIIGAPSGLAVNNFNAGEWMIYTINVQTPGTYEIGILTSAAASGGSNRAFRIEIDGTDVTGTVAVPDTSSWDDYQWVMKPGVTLTAGQHQLKLVSVAQYFRIDKIQLATGVPPPGCNAGTSRPYEGSPINGAAIQVASPGTTTFEAEHFNCGGEGQGYHEISGQNAGQTFRADEGVDIIAAPGGLAVNEFATGEWLEYTLNVAADGTYDISILAASNWSPSPYAFRLEVDGVPVAGDVTVTNTGGWDTYQWFKKSGVTLNQGLRRLRLVSATQYFRVDKLRVETPTPPGNCPDGADFCVTFDQASTTASGAQITAEGITWSANNKINSTTETDPTKRRVWLQNQVVRHGTHAVQMMAREDDTCVASGSGCDPNTSNERSEIHLNPAGPSPTGAQHGVTQWWAHSVYFPQQFLIRADDGGSGEKTAIFFQFHHGGAFPAIAMEVFGQIAPNAADRRKVFRVWSWGPKPGGASGESAQQYTYTAPGASGPRSGACFEHDVEEGVWYDFVHKIVWANNGTGEHHIWMRKAGSQTVAKVLAKTGLSIVYPEVWNRSSSSGDRTYAYLKIGVYHTQIRPGQQGQRLKKESGSYLPPLAGSEYVTTVIHDRVLKGGTYESVKMDDFPATLPTTGVNCNNQPLN